MESFFPWCEGPSSKPSYLLLFQNEKEDDEKMTYTQAESLMEKNIHIFSIGRFKVHLLVIFHAQIPHYILWYELLCSQKNFRRQNVCQSFIYACLGFTINLFSTYGLVEMRKEKFFSLLVCTKVKRPSFLFVDSKRFSLNYDICGLWIFTSKTRTDQKC